MYKHAYNYKEKILILRETNLTLRLLYSPTSCILAEVRSHLLVGYVYVSGARSSSAQSAHGDEARQTQENSKTGA